MQKTQASAKLVHIPIFVLAILPLCHHEAQAKNDISRGTYLSQSTSASSPNLPKNDFNNLRQKLTQPSANQNKENIVLPRRRPVCNVFFYSCWVKRGGHWFHYLLFILGLAIISFVAPEIKKKLPWL